MLPIIDSQKQIVNELEPFFVGNFKVIATEVYHDVKNYLYLVKHLPSNMKILYVTDTSSFDNISTKDVDIFCIECHHDNEWLDEKEEIDYVDMRNYSDFGHLSLQDCIEFLKNNINVNTKFVFLMHISSSFDNYKEFEEKVKNAINNENIKVIAVNPHLKEPLEIVLKKDIDINFD